MTNNEKALGAPFEVESEKPKIRIIFSLDARGAPDGFSPPRDEVSEKGGASGAAIAEMVGARAVPLWGFRGGLNPHRSRTVPFVP